MSVCVCVCVPHELHRTVIVTKSGSRVEFLNHELCMGNSVQIVPESAGLKCMADRWKMLVFRVRVQWVMCTSSCGLGSYCL